MLNSINIMGRITKDLELKANVNGKEYLMFSIACQRPFKNEAGQYEADFINCTAYGQTAQLIAKHSAKGKIISITGRLQVDNTDNTYYTKIIVQSVDVFTGNQREERSFTASVDQTASPADFIEKQDVSMIADSELPF